MPTRITPSVQRLLDRLAHTPVAVYDATWTLLHANAPYDALMGETSTWREVRFALVSTNPRDNTVSVLRTS